MKFDVVAIDELALDAEVVEEQVEAEVCPDNGRYGDYAEAVEHALGKAPGADALVNVEFFSAERALGLELCVKVVGEAVKR